MDAIAKLLKEIVQSPTETPEQIAERTRQMLESIDRLHETAHRADFNEMESMVELARALVHVDNVCKIEGARKALRLHDTLSKLLEGDATVIITVNAPADISEAIDKIKNMPKNTEH